MPQLSALSILGIAKEVTIGTYVAPALYIPTMSGPKYEDVKERIIDNSYDANRAAVRGIYDGVADSTSGWDSYLFPELPGLMYRGLGFADVVTGSNPYTHTFKLPSSGAQPISFSNTIYNTVEARGLPGSMLNSWTLKFDSKGAVTQTTAWNGWASAVQSTPTPSYPTSVPWLNWQYQVTINGVASSKVLSGEIVFTQPVDTIHTAANTQNPFTTFGGEINVAGKMRLVFDATTELALFLNNTQGAVVWTLTVPGGGSNPVMTITSTKTGYTKGVVDMASSWVAVDVDYTGIYNATDAGPAAITLLNAQSGAY